MSDVNQGTSAQTDEALEELLKHASPRPMPSRSDEAAVRRALRAEWRAVSGRHRSRRRIVSFAMAATVLIGLFAVFGLFRLPVVDAIQVATIEKSFGAIYLLGESSELRETPALSSVLSGQTIVTGDDAGIALAWGHGGSLRLDANTRLRFLDGESVYLEAGRVYFDSTPSALIAGIMAGVAADFLVTTDYGEVSHIGTQFMTRVDDRNLSVSVVTCIKWRLRAPKKIQVKAQPAVNGRSLNKDCNAGLELLWGSRRAIRESIICCVAPLEKDWAIPCEAGLAANTFSYRLITT